MSTLDFLSIGNVTRDIIISRLEQFIEIGGPSYYASKVCENFGLKSGICTNFSDDFQLSKYLPNTTIFSSKSESTTTFINNYREGSRTQKLVNNASFLDFKKFSYLNDLVSPKVVFYCPVFNEVSPEFLSIFTQSKKICNLQGWIREVGPKKRIKHNKLLPNLDFSIFDAIVLSDQDLVEDQISRLTSLSSLVCLTKGKDGCVIIKNQKEIKFDAVQLPKDAVVIQEQSDCVQYLASRGLTPSDGMFFYAPSQRDRIIIPVEWQSRPIGFVARAMSADTRPKYFANVQPGTLFNMDKQHWSCKFVIVVEGIFDAVVLASNACLPIATLLSPSVFANNA